MSINLQAPELRELKPRIMVCGVGGAGGNAVNNMISSGLVGVDFIVANTDAQALTASQAERIIQMGLQVTEGLGAGSQPDVGRAAAEEAIEEIRDHLSGAHMCFVTAGMGGGTGTGAAPVIAQTAREMGILTVGVVTKPFQFEGQRRMRIAESGIGDLQSAVDTLIVIPNQNLFRVANEKTTFADAFAMADQVLYSGVSCITDLMVKEGLINLDFADVRSIMREMGKAMMGTGEASGEKRAIQAAEAAIANPLLDETSMKGARGLLISITGGNDLTLYEVDEAASRIRQEVDDEANIILGATFDQSLDGIVRVSVVATGIDHLEGAGAANPADTRIAEVAQKLRSQNAGRNEIARQQPARPAAIETVPPVAASEPAEQPKAESAPAPAPAQAVAPVAESRPAVAAQQQPAEQAPWQGHDLPPQQVMDEVFLKPAQQPRPVSYAPPPAPPAPAEEEYAPQDFIPEPAEEPLRPARMPQVEDLPLPGRNQLREREARVSGEVQQPNAAEVKRRSLLERLASFSMQRDPEPAPQQRGEPVAPMPPARPQVAQAPAPAPAPASAAAHAQQPVPQQAGHVPAPAPQQQAGPAPSATHAEYGKRPVAPQPRPQQQQLDLHGRPAPQQQRSLEDEQLEIPAFLRRQTG